MNSHNFLQILGVAVGSGWQAVVAYVNLATYYFIGLPIGCILGFKTSLQEAVSLFHFFFLFLTKLDNQKFCFSFFSGLLPTHIQNHYGFSFREYGGV